MKRSLQFSGAIVGGFFAFGPVWGALGTMLGMMRAFRILGQSGVSDPRALSSAIGEVLLATSIGLVTWPFGAVLCAYCIDQLLKTSQRSPSIPPALRG